VCNNFSTTEKGIELIISLGGKVKAIVCFLNRSPTMGETYFSPTMSCKIPVVSLVRKVIPEYRQHHQEVAEDVARGNIVWDPKLRTNWDFLMQQMEKYE